MIAAQVVTYLCVSVLSASSSVDSNTSRSVWSNLYLMWLVNVFLCGGGGGGGIN